MAKKSLGKLLVIDADLWDATKEYVEAQVAIIRKYGGEPRLPEGGVEALTRSVAQYPQQVRNLTKKTNRKSNEVSSETVESCS